MVTNYPAEVSQPVPTQDNSSVAAINAARSQGGRAAPNVVSQIGRDGVYTIVGPDENRVVQAVPPASA